VITDRQGRAMPASPDRIELSYTHRQSLASSAEEGPPVWRVSADIPHGGQPMPAAHIGDIEIVLINPGDSGDAFGVLGAASGDLRRIAKTILDPRTGQLNPELADRLDSPGNRILILHRVTLTPEWRGFSIGILLAAMAIKRLSGGCQAAACYPAPASGDPAARSAGTPSRPGIASLAQVWSRVGFEHFRNGVCVLDLSLDALDEAIIRLRTRLRHCA
jgi:hypothetical protein